MKRKLIVLVCAMMLLGSALGLAEGGISVSRKQISLHKTPDRNVTNIVMLLQNGEETELILLASINTRSGRAVMTCINTDMQVTLPETGETALRGVYAMGDRKSRGNLIMRTLNDLLSLDVATYVVLDMGKIPELVDMVDGLDITPTQEEDAALGLDLDTWALNGEESVAFMKLKLPSDDVETNRSYMVLMELLQKVTHSGIGEMMGAGGALLSSMDTNLGIMTAVTLSTTVHGGSERLEISLPREEMILQKDPLRVDSEKMKEKFFEVLYE